MKMIELTNKNNNKFYINTDKIESIYLDVSHTIIHVIGDGKYYVKETPEEILNKISYNETNMLYDIQCIVSDRLEEIFASLRH